MEQVLDHLHRRAQALYYLKGLMLVGVFFADCFYNPMDVCDFQ